MMQSIRQSIKDFQEPTCCEVHKSSCNQGRDCPVRNGAHKPAEAVHQIQQPSASEQAAWHAGLDEGRAQKSCLVQIQEPAPVLAAQPQALAAIFAARGALQHLKEGGKPTEALINCVLQAIDSVAEPQASPAAVAVPDGWKLVPVVPTAAMLESAVEVDKDGYPATYQTLYMTMVGAALAATPVNCDSLEQLNENKGLSAAAPVVLPEPVAFISTVYIGDRKHVFISPDGSMGASAVYTAPQAQKGQA